MEPQAAAYLQEKSHQPAAVRSALIAPSLLHNALRSFCNELTAIGHEEPLPKRTRKRRTSTDFAAKPSGL